MISREEALRERKKKKAGYPCQSVKGRRFQGDGVLNGLGVSDTMKEQIGKGARIAEILLKPADPKEGPLSQTVF